MKLSNHVLPLFRFRLKTRSWKAIMSITDRLSSASLVIFTLLLLVIRRGKTLLYLRKTFIPYPVQLLLEIIENFIVLIVYRLTGFFVSFLMQPSHLFVIPWKNLIFILWFSNLVLESHIVEKDQFIHLKNHYSRDFMPNFTTDFSPFTVRIRPGKRREELSSKKALALRNPSLTGHCSTSSTASGTRFNHVHFPYLVSF